MHRSRLPHIHAHNRLSMRSSLHGGTADALIAACSAHRNALGSSEHRRKPVGASDCTRKEYQSPQNITALPAPGTELDHDRIGCIILAPAF
eukprot:5549248-Prymnesium_polylepis.1